jgi:hypothetical protein
LDVGPSVGGYNQDQSKTDRFEAHWGDEGVSRLNVGKNLTQEHKKVSENASTIPGERLMLDISYIKQTSLGKRNMWTLIEDQASKMKWSLFTRRKCNMVDVTLEFIRGLKAKDTSSVKFLWMDNAGENISLKNKLLKSGMEVQVEFISPNTPEQNGQVGHSFATLWGQVRAMLNNSGVGKDLRNNLCDSN